MLCEGLFTFYQICPLYAFKHHGNYTVSTAFLLWVYRCRQTRFGHATSKMLYAIYNAILPKIGNILVDLNIYLCYFFNVPRAPASLHHSSSSSVCGDTDLWAKAAGAECGAAETPLHHLSRVRQADLWSLLLHGSLIICITICCIVTPWIYVFCSVKIWRIEWKHWVVYFHAILH